MGEVFEALFFALCAVGAAVLAVVLAYWVAKTGAELHQTWRDWRDSR